MTRDRWERIKDIVGTVLEGEPGDRQARLRKACAGDTSLEAEVETILASTENEIPPTVRPRLVARFSPEKVLSRRFRIVRFIGNGGMGEVYEAEDQVVGGRVAVKVLRRELAEDPRVLSRFRQEVQHARKVTHINVCRIYDLSTHVEEDGTDVPYLTMELLVGETLSQRLKRLNRPMTVEEARPVAAQMVDALEAAHTAGVVHRDFKSANVMIAFGSSGAELVKVTDFGLARASNADEITVVGGGLVGSPAYMAPEQVEGKVAGPAADIYSLGVVLYEMLTGTFPFTGDNPVAVAFRRLKEPPPSPSSFVPGLDPLWERAILSCLQRQPENRPGSALQVLEIAGGRRIAPGSHLSRRFLIAGAAMSAAVASGIFLSRSGNWLHMGEPGTEPGGRPLIAVLRFDNKGGEPDGEYFSDGMTEEVISALTRSDNVEVLARTSAFQVHAANSEELRALREKLGVSYVLTGTVHRSGKRLRINTSLVRVSDLRNIWAQTYDRQMEDVFAVQDEIARRIVSEVSGRVSPAYPRNPDRETENLQAYQLYLKGRYFLNKRRKADVTQAVSYFQQAIQLDPRYSLAYTGLADCYSVMADYAMVPPLDAIGNAREAAAKALQLHGNSAEAHASRGLAASLDIWNYAEAEAEFQRSIQLNGKYAPAHQWYAVYLTKRQRMKEAEAEFRIAEQMDPLSAPMLVGLAFYHYYNRQPAQLQGTLEKLAEIDPAYGGLPLLRAISASAAGHNDRALAGMSGFLPVTGSTSIAILPWLGYFLARTGKKAEAQKVSEELQRRRDGQAQFAFYIAMVYASAGMTNQALTWLGTAYSERDPMLLHLNLLPHFDSVRTEARYKALQQRLGLESTAGKA